MSDGTEPAVPGTNPEPTLSGAGRRREKALAVLNRLLDEQAFTMAATDLFHLSSMLFLALSVLVWLSARPPRVAVLADAGAH